MPRFSDPVGHVRPYTSASIPFPELSHPLVFVVSATLFCTLLFAVPPLTPGTMLWLGWVTAVVSSFSVPLVVLVMACLNRLTQEERVVIQMTRTPVGKALLQEGTELHRARCWLEAEQYLVLSPLPFCGVQTLTGRRIEQDTKSALWELQLARETNLLDRQRRHLAGETVAYIEKLSCS